MYLRSELLKAIHGELSMHQYRMALIAWTMRAKIMDMPDDFVAWMFSVTKEYRGPEFSSDVVKLFSMLAKESRAMREAALASLSDPTKGKSLKEYGLPLLQAHGPELAHFP